MKILHTADLHLGQVIYQNYDRTDEHDCFFAELEQWCRDERPDALIVSGDVFDIQQPSATTWKAFTRHFVRLHRSSPGMHIVIVAGNHDSASRLQSHDAVWQLADVHLVGTPPPADAASSDGWQERFIVRLPEGYIVALPYMTGERTATLQALLDHVAAENTEGKPVVMTGHLAVAGCDTTGHDPDVGHVRTQSRASLGLGYDYFALGHIHKPQTIGREADCMEADVTYPAPVIRYAGSALHVSCDEQYPHTVSCVEIDRHGGNVRVRQLRIHELRHFHILPSAYASFTNSEDALEGIRRFAEECGRGYIRLQLDQRAVLPSDFNQAVYALIEPYKEELRYNPKILWTGPAESHTEDFVKPKFEVAEIQQMTDPVLFIEKTQQQYPELDMDEVREAFVEIEAEMRRMAEESNATRKRNRQS